MVDLVFKDSEKKHKFHLVNPSPWPLVGAFSALFLVSGAILYMHYEMLWPMIAGLVLILFTMFMWWRDIIKESTFCSNTFYYVYVVARHNKREYFFESTQFNH